MLLPVLAVLFGLFEYGRLLMTWNVLNNSAREGCRYALVNNTSTTINTDVQTLVTNYMAGQNAALSNFTVSVSGLHQGVSTSVNNLVAGDLIIVTVSGQYKFMNIIPWVKMTNTITLSSSVTMVCEGVT